MSAALRLISAHQVDGHDVAADAEAGRHADTDGKTARVEDRQKAWACYRATVYLKYPTER